MIFVAHRINSVDQLQTIPKEYGVEIDVRDSDDELILSHDPFSTGTTLKEYLKHYDHKLLIVNIKSYGIEKKIYEYLNMFNIQNFFFLDSSISNILNLQKSGKFIFSGRISEYENIDNFCLIKNFVEWAWVDCFTKFSLSKKSYKIIKALNIKICLTSPDLLGRYDHIRAHARLIRSRKVYPDAICSKIQNISKWKEYLDI